MSIEELIAGIVRREQAPLLAEVKALRRIVEAREESATFGTAELEKLLGKRGSALREWLRRHHDFPRRRVGRKLVFDRAKVEAWLAEEERRKAG